MRTVLFVSLMTLAAAAAAQQYKWVDPSTGRVRYGDLPPPGVAATPLRAVPSGPASPAPSDAAKKGGEQLSPEAAFQKRQQEAQKQQSAEERARQLAAAKQENCARARANVQMLQSGERVARLDAKGERQYLTDEEIARELVRARAEMERACAP